MKSSLIARMITWTSVVFAVMGFTFVLLAWRMLSIRVNREATAESGRQATELIRRLGTIDRLMRDQVNAGMRLLQDETQFIGEPSVNGVVSLKGKEVLRCHDRL